MPVVGAGAYLRRVLDVEDQSERATWGNAPLTVTDGKSGLFGILRSRLQGEVVSGRFAAHAEILVSRPLPLERLHVTDMEVRVASATSAMRIVVLESDVCCVLISVLHSSSRLEIFAGTQKALDLAWIGLERMWGDLSPLEHSLRAQRWVGDGAASRSETVEMARSDWTQIRRNYPRTTAKALDLLMDRGEVPENGRLAIFHGAPGTGKTHAVRALMTQWSSWATLHVVTDPDRLVEDPAYLRRVMEDRQLAASDGTLPSLSTPPRLRCNLIVCEDVGESVTGESHKRVGPGLSRLLNATDGVFSGVAPVVVLLTTNEPIDRLHPALTRPGRCFAAVPFTTLSLNEARSWCGPDVAPPSRAVTLAELFALARGDQLDTPIEPAQGMYL